MPEEKPQLNIYEKMTPNEEVYYSFLKNLQFVFAELASQLEKSRDIHLELSKNCGDKLFTPIKTLISEGLQSKAEFEYEKVKNDKLFEE